MCQQSYMLQASTQGRSLTSGSLASQPCGRISSHAAAVNQMMVVQQLVGPKVMLLAGLHLAVKLLAVLLSQPVWVTARAWAMQPVRQLEASAVLVVVAMTKIWLLTPGGLLAFFSAVAQWRRFESWGPPHLSDCCCMRNTPSASCPNLVCCVLLHAGVPSA
jgi:hypothetical protein